MTDIQGMWPGGPGGDGGTQRPARRSRLRTVEERSSARSDSRRRRSRRGRRARVLFGFAAAVGLAGAVGWGLGVRAHRTQQELIAEQTAERRQESGGLEALVKGQSTKIIQQMWLTEIMDAQRR